VLLLAALTLLPWQADRTAIQAPNAAAGITATVAATVLVSWLAAATLITRPAIPHPGTALLVLAGVCLGLVVLKLVTDPDDLAVGAWASLLFAAILVVLRVPAISRR
jgi:hypothetical protein